MTMTDVNLEVGQDAPKFKAQIATDGSIDIPR